MGETDLISRQAAIDEIIDSFECGDYLQTTLRRLKNLPSAQLERWIPCSERLPEAQTEVIVSCTDDSGDTRFSYTSSGWVTTDGEYWIVDNEINHFVVAWMPLPEPYKGEQE